MARLLRSIAMTALCAALMASTACEDDPNDLDYLRDAGADQGEPDPDEEDAG